MLKQISTGAQGRQKGITLILGLVMALLITIVGLAAIRGSNLQEMMAGNMRDRHLAFDAAEAALREGEEPLSGAAGSIPIGTKKGFYESFDRPGRGYWLGQGADSFKWADSAAVLSDDLAYISEKPRFVVEKVSFLAAGQFGGASDWASLLEAEPEIMYRVTSRGVGGSDQTVVVLQSTYK